MIATSLLLSLVAGCGDSGPTTYPVTGTVKLDGVAVERATVTFLPDDMENGKPAVGQTDADGNYFLTSVVSGDGAVAGSYKIQVTKYNTPDGGANPYGDGPAAELDKELTPEEQDAAMEAAYESGAADMEKAMKKGARQAAPDNELPGKYASIMTSELSFAVSAEGENKYDIELTKKRR